MKELTEKAKIFCQEYVRNGYNARHAYKYAYKQTDDAKASVSASQLMKDTRVQGFIDSVEGTYKLTGLKNGLTKDAIIKTLKKMMNAKKIVGNREVPDWTARNNAILTFSKLTGTFKEKDIPEEPKYEEDKEDLKELSFTELIEKKKKIESSL